MLIKLIRRKLYYGTSYKYMSYDYCCDSMKNSDMLLLTDKAYDDVPMYAIKSVNHSHPVYTDNIYNTNNYPVYTPVFYCPYCGEKIEIQVILTKDVSAKDKELQDAYEKTLFYRGNGKQILADKINYLYHFGKINYEKEEMLGDMGISKNKT